MLQRTLAAASAVGEVDGSSIRVTRANGAVETAVQGFDEAADAVFLSGPPGGASFVSGRTTWQGQAVGTFSTGLVVPIGSTGIGTLTVFSRNPDAFDAEAVTLLGTIARYAATAIDNALLYLDVQDLALTDARTGLGSQLAFDEALPRLVGAASRTGRPLSLIQIDLDDFGAINKEYSPEVGNEVLSDFGARVLASKRASDEAFRNSGGADEFFIFLPDTTRDSARLLYDRLVAELRSRPLGEVSTLTLSSGLVELRSDDTPKTFTMRSGRLVQKAKDLGKDQLCDDREN